MSIKYNSKEIMVLNDSATGTWQDLTKNGMSLFIARLERSCIHLHSIEV